jgi:hypothetical protein
MSATKETAVSELYSEINSLFTDLKDGTIGHQSFESQKEALLESCLAKEKQQMVDFVYAFHHNVDEASKAFLRDEFENYYNENYILPGK